MPSCKNMLMYCNWRNEDVDCLRLFKVFATDDGFCCTFNAKEPQDVLKEESKCVTSVN